MAVFLGPSHIETPMNNQAFPPIKAFDFAPGITLRSVQRDGCTWFIAADICKALGYSNTAKAIADNIDPEDQIELQLGLAGRAPLAVNESGLYSLVLRSNKPTAREFKRWVTSVVLPALRQSSAYVVGQEKVDLAAMSYAEAQAHIENLKAQVAEAEAIRWAKSREDRDDYREAMRFLRRKVSRAPRK